MHRKSVHGAAKAASIAASPRYQAGCWGHRPWLHGDSPRSWAQRCLKTPQHPPRPSAAWVRAAGRRKRVTSAEQGQEHEGERDRSAPAPQPPRLAAWGPRAATATPLPSPSRVLNGGHSSACPLAAGSCRPAKEPPRVPGAGRGMRRCPGCKGQRVAGTRCYLHGDRVSWEPGCRLCH